MTLIHEAEVVSDMMVKNGQATPEEGEWLKSLSLYGLFPYQIAKFSGSSCRQVETLFQHQLLGQRMRRHNVGV